MPVFYWFAKTFVVAPLCRVLFRPWVRGLENVPTVGGAIIASNHLSVSDSVILPVLCPRPISFLAKKEYFTGNGMKGLLTRRFFLAANQLPMDRTGGTASLKSLDSGRIALTEGKLLGIYPEGTRSPDGRLYRGKVGVARLALETGLPIIPVAMIGTDRMQPIGQRIPSLRRVGMIVGEPIPGRTADITDQAAMRELTDQVMASIQRLSGQEYVDRYAQDVKDEQAAKLLARRKATPAG